MRREHFEALVEAAIDALPQEFQEGLENIAVVVEDWPSAEQVASAGVKHRSQMLGLYEGIPLTERGYQPSMVLPDKITIFQRPIERCSHSEEEMVRTIGETVRHEIAHYYGIGEDRLMEIEERWRR
ncbi:MAG: metallopeptidase family protein [Chloroflexota bacterium]|nr:metallopeptidase family protein [Chloroflexota bacterium]